MSLFAEQLPWNPIVPVAMLAVTACAAVWVWMAVRWWQRRPVVSYQPRRPVPWHAVDLAVIVLFYLALQSGLIELAGVVLGPATQAQPPSARRVHHAARRGQLMAEGNVWVFLLCVVSAVVVAPVARSFSSACCCRAGWKRWSTVGGGRCRRCGG